MRQIKMKAAICRKYGPPEVLQLAEVKKPSAKENEILVKIMASAVTASDIFIRSSAVPLRMKIPMRLMMGITKPRRRVEGLVFSGIVENAGKEITRFSPGDSVYGMTGFSLGTYAEYACIKETDSKTGCVSLKPKNISFEKATSAVYGGFLALQFMDRGHIKANDRILVYGASSTSGTIAVQYGKYLGAEVTAVSGAQHLDFVKSLGADVLIDYTTTDALDDSVKFDFILDSVGKMKTSTLKKSCQGALAKGGKYISIDDGYLQLNSKRLDLLTGLIEAGKIKPIVDRIYPLEKIVEAHRYVEEGHKTGGVAITISHQNKNAP
jgi:NADPH:quinone reductase-like Zn-dependent oxidoreductase